MRTTGAADLSHLPGMERIDGGQLDQSRRVYGSTAIAGYDQRDDECGDSSHRAAAM
jgi:hypothetical protein